MPKSLKNQVVDFGGIVCPDHGYQQLTWEEYYVQMNNADELWKCPLCRKKSIYIDQDDMDSDYDHDIPF